MRLLRSSALTLAVGYVCLGLAALALFATPLWMAWRATIQEGRNEILQAESQRLTETFRREGADGLVTYITNRVGMQIANDRILLLADASLRPLAGNLASWPTALPATPGSTTVPVTIGGSERTVAFVHVRLPDGYQLLVGRDTSRFEPLERRFWTALAFATLILLVVGTIGGVLIRRALLSRIQGIQRSVSAIMLGDLTHRLPTIRHGDELNTLSQTINRMLEQIEHLINGVRHVSNSIAHDLRTPLAELRSRLEELSLTRPAPERTFSEIDEAVADVDRVIRVFNALLRLAEIDSGLRRSGFVAVDVAALADEAVEFYLPSAELNGLSLEARVPEAAQVRGDPVLLAQALGNLIDNAIKYSAEHGRVVVAVQRRDGKVWIEVTDNGPGIPVAERPKVVERFYRGDASRGSPGVGLGLSLVDAVARLHGGALRLSDNEPGLRAAIELTQDTPPPQAQSLAGTTTQGAIRHEPAYP